MGNVDLKLYIGSDNWNSLFSINKPQSFSDTTNPFGCGVAVCIAVSNLFRSVFKEYLGGVKLDEDVVFSTINYNTTSTKHNPELNEVIVKDTVFAGLGAIGNGSIWALLNLEDLSGRIDLVDKEEIELTNLQRYVMFAEEDIDRPKVQRAAEFLKDKKFDVNPFKKTWSEYLEERGNWNIGTVLVSIDNKKDRIGIQSSLPRKIFNAYTETRLLGIARHLDFIESACLACGYILANKEKNYINEVADNCNIPQSSALVKDYINLNLDVNAAPPPPHTQSLLDLIANANSIDRQSLNQFNGKKVEEFYSEFVCGGILLSLSDQPGEEKSLEAPLAFQSAMAGILLAAELVIEDNHLRNKPIKKLSHINPLIPLGAHNPYNHQLEKDKTGRCLCRDEDFRKRYVTKWKVEQ